MRHLIDNLTFRHRNSCNLTNTWWIISILLLEQTQRNTHINTLNTINTHRHTQQPGDISSILILCCSGVMAQLWHNGLFIRRILHACWRSRPLPHHFLPRFPWISLSLSLTHSALQILPQQTQSVGASNQAALEREVTPLSLSLSPWFYTHYLCTHHMQFPSWDW